MTEDKMVGWHHWLNGHDFEQVPGHSEGQGNMMCCSPWGHKELDTTERRIDNNLQEMTQPPCYLYKQGQENEYMKKPPFPTNSNIFLE